MADLFNGQACDLAPVSPLPETVVPAMAYVPFQQFNGVYQPEKGLDNGTIFAELDKPFYGRRIEPR